MRIKLEKNKPPFKGAIQIYSEGATVQNRFGGDSVELNALELSIYDKMVVRQIFFEKKLHLKKLDKRYQLIQQIKNTS